jgi:uncharacterized protein with HEPN domain
MKKDYKIFLEHILENIAKIEKYTNKLSEEDFLDNEPIQDLVLRKLEIIGEAITNIPQDFRDDHPEIEWNKAVATRNILIHHYFDIDLRIIWDTVKINLPKFKEQIQSII